METPSPFINYYGPVNRFYGPLQDLTETPYPSAKHYGPVNRLYGPLQDLPYPLRTTLYSMADISKQISDQKKWSQGVDLTSANGVNDYINFKIFEYGHYKLLNDNLWEQNKEDFADFMETVFKACSLITICNLRTLLHN
jgi:hypothetical protein